MAINIRNLAGSAKRGDGFEMSASSAASPSIQPSGGRVPGQPQSILAGSKPLHQPLSRGALSRSNRSDVSIQVDVTASGGQQRDKMGRSGNKKSGGGASQSPAASGREPREIPLYSREDISEQYVISSKKELDGAHRRAHKGLFGCLASRKDHGGKKKTKRAGWFALCVRRASEENLYNGCNKPVANTNRSVTLPAIKPFTVPLKDEGSQGSSLFRHRPQSFCTSDPRRFSLHYQPPPAATGTTSSAGLYSSLAGSSHTFVSPAGSCIVNAPRHSSDPEWKFNIPVQRALSDAGADVEGADPSSGIGGVRTFRYGGRLAYTQPNTPDMSAALYRRQVMSSEALVTTDESGRPLGRPTGLGGSSSAIPTKHVSFDDGSSPTSPASEIYTAAVPANASKSTERLLETRSIGGRSVETLISSGLPPACGRAPPSQHQHQQQASFSPVLARAILLERLRQASMRSQSTQTEILPGGCYNSTTSLSYPASCLSGDSQMSIPSASVGQTQAVRTRSSQVQTSSSMQRDSPRRTSYPSTTPTTPVAGDDDSSTPSSIGLLGRPSCIRLTKSSSNLNDDPDDDDNEDQDVQDGIMRHQQMDSGSGSSRKDSASLPDDEGCNWIPGRMSISVGDMSSSPGRRTRGISSGRSKRRIKAGIQQQQLLKALSEGTILLLDRKTARPFASGYVEVSVVRRGNYQQHQEEEEERTGRIQVQETPPESSSDDELLLDGRLLGQQQQQMNHSSNKPHELPVREKSFDSNASLPDTPPGNYSDEAPSFSQVTVVNNPAESSIQMGNESPSPPPPPPHRRQASESNNQTFLPPPLPAEIPKEPPSSDQHSHPSDSEKEIMVQFPPWTPPEEENQAADSSLIPAPASFAAMDDEEEGDDDDLPPPPPMEEMSITKIRERVSLRQLKEGSSGSKSFSETVTSMDESDSSGDGIRKRRGRRRMGKNEGRGDGTEHETSSASSTHSPDGVMSPISPPEENPAQLGGTKVSNDTSSEAAFLTAMSDPHQQSPSPKDNNGSLRAGGGGGSDTSRNSTLRLDHQTMMELPYEEGGGAVAASPLREEALPSPEEAGSSTSGSYSLEAGAPLDEEGLSAPFCPPKEFSSATDAPPPTDEGQQPDRRTLKLQFASGSSMFHNPGGSTITPTRSSGGRRVQSSKPLSSSSDSGDETPVGERSVRNKRRPKGAGRKQRPPLSDSGAPELLLTPGMVRSPAMHEGFRPEDWITNNPPTEPGPSEEFFRLQHPSESSESGAINPPIPHPSTASGIDMARWLAPSPSGQHKNGSVRSASPGSDSVFLSEGSARNNQGAEGVKPPEGFADSPVRSSPPTDVVQQGSTGRKNGSHHHKKGNSKRSKSCAGSTSLGSIQGEEAAGLAPEGSPRTISASEVMWYPETQLPPKRQLTVRAKSEERERWNRPARRNIANLAKSMEANWDSVANCDGTPLDDEDAGIYNASYRASAWAYIGETEELQVWRRSNAPIMAPGEADDSSTASEKDFRRKYTSITHRMVHRKSSVEMFRRLATSTFECDDIVLVRRESGEFGFRIHGSRPVVVSAIEPGTPAEISGLQVGDIIISINDVNVLDSSHSDVVRIAHTGTDELKLEVARTCHVLAGAAAAAAQLDAASGGQIIAQEADEDSSIINPAGNNNVSSSSVLIATNIIGEMPPIMTGYLWKKSQSASRVMALDSAASAIAGDTAAGTANVWYRRWFALKRDNCLYYYKNQESSQPLGAVSLLHYTVTRSAFTDRPHGLLLSKGGTIRHWLAAESTDSVEQWQSVFNYASKAAIQQDVWLEVCAQNILLPPSSMTAPDCVGHLMKLGHRAKEWQRRFCLLKDACLYFYVDINVSSALGALHLHGYRVQSSGTTASSGERRKFAFELLPPEPRMRHFHFYTDSENDRKRWIAALEYSIDRWIRVG